MARPRHSGRSLHEQYGLHLQIGLALALTLLLGVAQVDFPAGNGMEIEMELQETVDLQHIQQTRQDRTHPAPPQPAVPQVVPNNEVIEARDIDFDASLDLNTSLAKNVGPSSPPEESSETDKVFVDVQKRPDCGGMQALQKKTRYPPTARKLGLEGRVFVQFVVDGKGRMTNPRVVRGTHEVLDKAALRSVERLDCTPGKQRSRPVKVKMTTPVLFTFSNKSQPAWHTLLHGDEKRPYPSEQPVGS